MSSNCLFGASFNVSSGFSAVIDMVEV